MNLRRALSRTPDLPLAALLTAFALLVVMHSLATPPFEAPDEVWHYAYVRWLAEGNGLPPMDSDISGANQEVAQPPLYYVAAAVLGLPFGDDDLQDLLWHNPGFGYQAPGTSRDNKAMLIHPRSGTAEASPAERALRVSRLASLGFGLVTVLAAYKLGHETFGTHRAALTLGATVAFHPQFVFLCGVLNNDSAAAALSTVCLWVIARCARRGITVRRAAALGALAGATALTKTSGLLMVALAAAALLWLRQRQRASWKPLLFYGAAAATLGGWWYGWNLARYGDPLGLTAHVATLWGREATATLRELLPEMPILARSFWAAYGWGHVTWPDSVYWGLGALSLAALGVGAARAARAPRGVTIWLYGVAMLWLGGVGAALLRWMQQVEAPHGRLLFPALSAWALLLTAGLTEWNGDSPKAVHRTPLVRSRRWRPLFAALRTVLLASLAVVSALAPGVRLAATFAPPRLMSPEEALAKVQTPTDLIYGDGIRLLGVTIPGERLHPGEEFTIRACWMALRPQSVDYTVFIHAIGPGTSRAAERHTYPGLGTFPSTLWPVGQAFCDRYLVSIEPWAEVPLAYELLLGLFDAATGERLVATRSDGNPAEPPFIGKLVVVSEAPIVEKVATPAVAILDNSIALCGFSTKAEVRAGEVLTVTLDWGALQASEVSYTAFVHLWEPGMEEPLAQSDAQPRQGWYPTQFWQRGDHVSDIHMLQIPADAPAGEVRLWAGLYRSTDGVRAAAFADGQPYTDNLIPLGSVCILEAP